jgi:hypothetical protein
MFTFSMFRSQSDRPSTRRPQVRRRPLVETLEGRQLLSTVAAIQGAHIGTNVAAIQGAHIGSNVAAIQGAHIGTNVSEIQGAHIGTMAMGGGGVGQHIGC